MTQAKACLNCNEPLVGRFCSACGQRDVDPERGLLSVVGDLVGEAFEADGRLHTTVGPFFLRPGEVTAEWVEGKRARYTSPARIFVFALFVGFVGIAIAGQRSVAAIPENVVDHEDGRVVMAYESSGSSINIDFDDLEGFTGTEQELARGLMGEMVEGGPKATLLLVPAFALVMQLLLWRQQGLRHMVFSLNLHSRLLLLGGIAVAIPFRGPGWVAFVAMQLYLLLGLRRAYSLTWGGALWRHFVLSACWFVLWIATLMLLVLWAVWRFDQS